VGILGTHDTRRRQFSREDVDFVQSVANVLAEAIERKRYQGELEGPGRRPPGVQRAARTVRLRRPRTTSRSPCGWSPATRGLIEKRYADELDADGEEFLEYAVDGADRMRDMIDGLLQ